jgi:hypothetical protein
MWATTRTLRHEAARAVEEKRDATQKLIEERGQAAGQTAMNELYALRRHINRWRQDLDAESVASWARTGEELADQAEMAVGLIPQSQEIRTRMNEALWVVTMYMSTDQDRPDREPYSSKRALRHAIAILQAFMRGDELPDTSYEVDDLRMQQEMYRIENPPDAS